MPAISVIIPSYNGGPWLARAVQSVREQDFTDWEIIIVDDGSTDERSLTVARGLVDDRVRLVVHERNQGLAAARNTGIEHARGDIIVPLDADDRLPPGALKAINDGFTANPDADFLFGKFDETFWYSGETRHHDPGPQASLHDGQWTPWCGCSPFRRAIWKVTGGYDGSADYRRGPEDWDFWVRVVAAGGKGVYVPAALYEHIRRPGSLSDEYTPDWLHAVLRTFSKLDGRIYSESERKARIAEMGREVISYWRRRAKPQRSLPSAMRVLWHVPLAWGVWRAAIGCLAEFLFPPLRRRYTRQHEARVNAALKASGDIGKR